MIRAIGNGNRFGVCDLSQRPDIYELVVRQEMKKLDAKGSDFDVLNHEAVWSCCSRHIPPEIAALFFMALRTAPSSESWGCQKMNERLIL